MRNEYEEREELYDLATEVLKEKEDLFAIAHSGARIGFLTSTEYKSKSGIITFADTRAVKGVWTYYVPYDFIITFYIRYTDLLSKEQLKILMWHELKHCGVKPNGVFYLIPHDVQDFSDILDKHGHKWANIEQVGGDFEKLGED